MPTIFGPIRTGWEVEQAVIAHLQAWHLTYLAELERHAGRTAMSLPPVRSWTTTPRSPEKWPEDQLPAVLVVNTGTVGDPIQEGSGLVRATWSIGIAVICSGATEAATHDLSKLYFAALRAPMVQHPALKSGLHPAGFADGVVWQGEQYDVLPPSSRRRSLAAAFGAFTVEVADVLYRLGGPIAPLENPYSVPSWPTVDETEVEIEKL